MFSSERMDWETPQDFFDKLNVEFHFTLDPCANEQNAKCKKFYTIEQDGLTQSWQGEIVFATLLMGENCQSGLKKRTKNRESQIRLL